MMSTSTTNKPSHIRFGGTEDDSNRSAWKTTVRSTSAQPPCCVQRKPTIGGFEALEKAKADADLVAALDDAEEEDQDTPLFLPSVLKHSTITTPILKNRKTQSNPPAMPSRCAWSNDEGRHSIGSIMPPCPAQRQKTLDEVDLRAACASLTALANDSTTSFMANESATSFMMDGVTRDPSPRRFRDPSLRNSLEGN